MDLLSYESSDDETQKDQSSDLKRKKHVQPSMQQVKRLKPLPKLSDTFRTAPIDDPSEHQGRARSRRWIEGDWNAHIFLKLNISPKLRTVLNDIVQIAQADLKRTGYAYTIYPLYDALEGDLSPSTALDPTDRTPPVEQVTHKELHISLTHPLPLRSHQIPALLEHLKVELSGAKNVAVKPFRLGLDCRVVKYRNGIARAASVTRADNGDHTEDFQQDEVLEDYEDDNLPGKQDEGQLGEANVRVLVAGLGKSGVGKGGRAFLALRVRAGHAELERIQSQIIDPFLKIHHLPTYHSDPEFHTSFAWVLVPIPADVTNADPAESGQQRKHVDDPFTDRLLEQLEAQFAQALLEAQPKGGWQIDRISTKIGKTATDFGLA